MNTLETQVIDADNQAVLQLQTKNNWCFYSPFNKDKCVDIRSYRYDVYNNQLTYMILFMKTLKGKVFI